MNAIEKLSEINGKVSLMDWSMICILIFFGTLVVAVMIMWWRVISSITEVIHIRHLKARRGRKYAEGAWGVHKNSLMTLLIVESPVALDICALIILVLSGARL